MIIEFVIVYIISFIILLNVIMFYKNNYHL